MSLDISLGKHAVGNITHNLGKMARHVGLWQHDHVITLYQVMWCPEEVGVKRAKDAIPFLVSALDSLQHNPIYFQQWNPENGWGNYENLVEYVERYITEASLFPNKKIKVSK